MKKFIVAILLLIPLIVILSINVSGLIISAEISIGIESITLTHQGSAVVSQQIMLEDYIETNKSYKLYADYYPRIAQNKSIIWESNDEKVATVKNGVVSFHDYGSVDIIATAESYTSVSATCTFYVIGEEISRINVSEFGENSPKTDFALKRYQVMPLKINVVPSTALSERVIYSSDNENVVTVDANGVLTANNTGSAAIVISADSKSGETVSESITVNVIGEALIKRDTVYTADPVVDLSSVINASDAELFIDNVKLVGTSVDIGNSEQVTVSVQKNGETEFITLIRKQTANALVFENITALMRGIWQNDNYITEGGSSVILKAVSAIGALPSDAAILWESNNEEIVSVIDGRLYGHKPGTATIRACLDGFDSAEVEVKVATAISYIRLDLDNSKDKAGLGETRVFGIKTCADKVISNQFPINISSSYPDISASPDCRQLFYYYSSNEEYATVNEDGIVTFYEEGAGHDVTITAVAKYSHIDAKDSYTFHLVDGINIGYGYDQNIYDEETEQLPSYLPYDDFVYLANDYKDDYYVNGTVSAIVFQTNVYMRADTPLVVICRSIYGNGYKFDGQFHTNAYNCHMFQWGIHGFFITERPCVVTIENLAIQSYKPTSDDSEEAFSELAVKGGLPWQALGTVEEYQGIEYRFKYCLFQYAYTHFDISAGTIIFEGCLFRNTAGPALYAGTGDNNAADLTLKNCIFSNIISVAFMSTCGTFPASLADASASRENVKYFTMRLEGENYFYNWKNINDLELKVIPDALTPLNSLNSSIAEWVRVAVKKSDREKFVYQTLKGDHINIAVVFLALWVENNLELNPSAEHFFTEGISLVADPAMYRAEDVDLSVIPVNELLKIMMRNYNIKLLSSPTNVVFAKGDKHGYNTMPDETYELNAATLARLRGE